MTITLKRANDAVHFQGLGHAGPPLNVDGSEAIGGANAGMRPMQLLLAALGSCSAMDLVTILGKQRQVIEDLEIEIRGERLDGTPSPFTAIHVVYRMRGSIDPERAEKAIDLALYKYCSVAATLSDSVKITHHLEVLP